MVTRKLCDKCNTPLNKSNAKQKANEKQNGVSNRGYAGNKTKLAYARKTTRYVSCSLDTPSLRGLLLVAATKELQHLVNNSAGVAASEHLANNSIGLLPLLRS